MADRIEPTQTEYNNAEQVALDIMSTKYESILTKSGSVIRELMLRPFAYLSSWLGVNISNTLLKTSMTYLSESQLTENEQADLVASNYFITRNAGKHSSGAVTVITTTSRLELEAGSAFDASGVTLVTERRTIATGSIYEVKNDIQYVPIFPSADGKYMATIPVVTADTGSIELPAGTQVDLAFGSSLIESVSLTSPVSGGCDTETDASMMARAKYNTADAGIGSYYGLRKKLDNAPIPVMSLNVVAGEDLPIYRARYNSVNINPGGMIDCYVKLQNQYSTDSMIAVSCTSTETSTSRYGTAVFYDAMHAGLYTVQRLFLGATEIHNYSVCFGTYDDTITAEGARLGTGQSTYVSAPELYNASAADVHAVVTYMPGIAQLQNFVDTDSNRFIGQDIKIKAAVPVAVRLDCTLKYDGTVTDDIITAVRKSITDKINSYPVGTKILNFSELRESVAASVAGADIRLPCAMSSDVLMVDGGFDSMYSTSGILNIASPAGTAYWDSAVCYFSTVLDNINVSAV